MKANILEIGRVSIVKTPHFKYLKNNKKEYIKYYKKYMGISLVDDHSPSAYDNLIKIFDYDKYGSDDRLIIIDKNNNILDGLHRACILKYNNIKDIKVLQR